MKILSPKEEESKKHISNPSSREDYRRANKMSTPYFPITLNATPRPNQTKNGEQIKLELTNATHIMNISSTPK